MTVPCFFVPNVAAENQEAAYAELARRIGQRTPATGNRIYSITFSHNGERWTATVGEPLRGKALKVSKIRGQKVEREVSLSNSSVVLAIFGGSPFHVWHDGASRTWANPFLAGAPSSTIHFSDAAG